MREAMPGIVKGADGKNYWNTNFVPFAFQLTECVVNTVVNTVS